MDSRQYAGTDYCGGFCYLNNVAIAARHLMSQPLKNGRGAKIAILDIDFHHGNGTEDIFKHQEDLLFISIHGDPDVDFPFFWGKAHDIPDDSNHHAINIQRNF